MAFFLLWDEYQTCTACLTAILYFFLFCPFWSSITSSSQRHEIKNKMQLLTVKTQIICSWNPPGAPVPVTGPWTFPGTFPVGHLLVEESSYWMSAIWIEPRIFGHFKKQSYCVLGHLRASSNKKWNWLKCKWVADICFEFQAVFNSKYWFDEFPYSMFSNRTLTENLEGSISF